MIERPVHAVVDCVSGATRYEPVSDEEVAAAAILDAAALVPSSPTARDLDLAAVRAAAKLDPNMAALLRLLGLE